jgi:chromatin modification-related protein EAF6
MFQAGIEDQIYRQETLYLEETSTAGNIVKGFDSYIKASSSATASAGTISGSAIGGGPNARRKTAVNDADRVFSRSSILFARDSDSPSSTTSTPNHAATPTGSFTAEKVDKKKKKSTAGGDDDDSKAEGRPQKRQKISFASRKSMQED